MCCAPAWGAVETISRLGYSPMALQVSQSGMVDQPPDSKPGLPNVPDPPGSPATVHSRPPYQSPPFEVTSSTAISPAPEPAMPPPTKPWAETAPFKTAPPRATKNAFSPAMPSSQSEVVPLGLAVTPSPIRNAPPPKPATSSKSSSTRLSDRKSAASSPAPVPSTPPPGRPWADIWTRAKPTASPMAASPVMAACQSTSAPVPGPFRKTPPPAPVTASKSSLTIWAVADPHHAPTSSAAAAATRNFASLFPAAITLAPVLGVFRCRCITNHR